MTFIFEHYILKKIFGGNNNEYTTPFTAGSPLLYYSVVPTIRLEPAYISKQNIQNSSPRQETRLLAVCVDRKINKAVTVAPFVTKKICWKDIFRWDLRKCSAGGRKNSRVEIYLLCRESELSGGSWVEAKKKNQKTHFVLLVI